MIRTAFITRANLSSGRTNVYNFAKTCEAVHTQGGYQATLITTDQPKDTTEFFRRMGVHTPFAVTCLGATSTDSPNVGKKWYELYQIVCANARLVSHLTAHSNKFEVVYFRDGTLAGAALWARMVLRKKVFFETHAVLKNKHAQFFNEISIRVAHGVVAISGPLKEHYQKTNPNIILSLCSAAEERWFDYTRNAASFREELGLPLDAFILGYVGVVGPNPNGDVYELDDIIKSLTMLPDTVVAVIAGELNNNADWLRAVAKESGVEERVTFLPWQERERVPRFLQAFDIELIPRRKKNLVGDSPAKMFPALASGRPIVAGRSESILEVLTHDRDALIIKSNTPEGWSEAIQALYDNEALRTRLVQGAAHTSRTYSWEGRGKAIAAFITSTL